MEMIDLSFLNHMINDFQVEYLYFFGAIVLLLGCTVVQAVQWLIICQAMKETK